MAFDADTPFLKHAQDLSLLCHFKGFERCAKVTIFQFQHLPCVSTPFQVNSMSCLWSGFNHDGQRPQLTSGLHILTFHGHGCRSSYSCCHRCFDCDRSWKFHKNHLHYSFQSPICTEHQKCLTSASMKWETSLSVMQVVKCLISARRAHHQTDMEESASHHSIMMVKDLNWRQAFIYSHFMPADLHIHFVIDVSIAIEAENFTKFIFIILSNCPSAQNIENAWLQHQSNEKRQWVSCDLSNVSFQPEGPTIRPIWRRVLRTIQSWWSKTSIDVRPS